MNNILSKYKPSMDNVLLILHEVQNDNPQNYLPKDSLKMVADYLNTTYSNIYGIATYYSMFSVKPRGKNIIRICDTHICVEAQEKPIIEGLKDFLNIKQYGDTTKDGLFTVESSECLGHCNEPTVVMINDVVHTNMNLDKLKQIINKIRTVGETK